MNGRPSHSFSGDGAGWAHQRLAIVRRNETERLEKNKIETIVLVDADLVIAQAESDPKNYFRDLFEGRPKHPGVALAVSEYFFSKLFADSAREITFGARWQIAPEHFGEVVRHADELVVEPKRKDLAQELPSSADTLRQMKVLLDRLKVNPWGSINKNLEALLSRLGLSPSAARTDLAVADFLFRWLGQHRSNVIGLPTADLRGRLTAWPRFTSYDDNDHVKSWVKVLNQFVERKTRDKTPRAVENDARVLTALALLNARTSETKRRYVLLTGSMHLLQAVHHGFDLMPQTLRDLYPQGTLVSDSIWYPTIVLGSTELWSSVTAGRVAADTSVADLFLMGDEAPSIDARAAMFEAICGRTGEDPDAADHRGEAGPGMTYPEFFRKNIATNMAILQVVDSIHQRREKEINTAKEWVDEHGDDMFQHLEELEEIATVRLRIQSLEWIISLDMAGGASTDLGPQHNPLRHPPYVDFGEKGSARSLADALDKVSSGTDTDADRKRAEQLKVAVYKEDPTTYLLVLVFAYQYARQNRWGWASAAARYAYRLSRSKVYAARREGDILGEEALLLDLACQRRGANTQNEVLQAQRALSHYEKSLQAEDMELMRHRLAVEECSILLTVLSMKFFTELVDAHLHDQCRLLLERSVKHLGEFRGTYGDESLAAPSAGVLRDVLARWTMNICNAAWMTVGRSVAEVKRGKSFGPKSDALRRYVTSEDWQCIDWCMKRLLASVRERQQNNARHPKFDWLSLVVTSATLAPDLLALSDEAERGRVRALLLEMLAQTYQHPYDKTKIGYALELVEGLRVG